MRYQEEYRDAARVMPVMEAIRKKVTRPWHIMEVCGGQTHSIVRFGIDALLPPEITLIHGPGCPVCVTPLELIDRAVAIARRPGVIFTSFGDMLRVPGSGSDLFQVKSEGGDVRIVYSPLDALSLAREHPDREVVFFAVGFETTAPGNALAVKQARKEGLTNFSILVSHVQVPPALKAVLGAPGRKVEGFLAAGHVCAVMGYHAYHAIAQAYRVPIVVTGFEPLDLARGLHRVIAQLEEGRFAVENAYERVVREEGNPAAQALIHEVFQVVDRPWRGIGVIPESGYALQPGFEAHDAERKFDVGAIHAEESPLCQAGLVLQGLLKPNACPAFGKACTPDTPLGATMVSSEGACAAYYRYRRE